MLKTKKLINIEILFYSNEENRRMTSSDNFFFILQNLILLSHKPKAWSKFFHNHKHLLAFLLFALHIVQNVIASFSSYCNNACCYGVKQSFEFRSNLVLIASDFRPICFETGRFGLSSSLVYCPFCSLILNPFRVMMGPASVLNYGYNTSQISDR